MKLLTKGEAGKLICPFITSNSVGYIEKCHTIGCMAWEYKTKWVEHEIKGIPKEEACAAIQKETNKGTCKLIYKGEQHD